MTNSVTPFNFGENSVRVIVIDDLPWFVIVDVCRALEISSPHNVVSRIDGDALRQAEVIDSRGRTQITNVVNEPGLYELVIRSDKPEALRFRKWIFEEVLPQIRKTGSYGRPQSQLDILAGAVQALQDQERRVLALEKMLGQQAIESAEKIAEVAASANAAVAKVAKRDAVEVSTAHSTVWGQVNAWPLEIWDEAYEALGGE